MDEITFSIDKSSMNLQDFSIDDLSGISKHLFYKWYNENYESTVSLESLDKQINKGLEPIINDLFGISKSVKKGKVFEHIIEETITKQTKHKYIDTSHIDHAGDGLLILESGHQCIIEMKNYSNIVPKSQLEKLKYDMRVSNIQYAIMFSTSPIQGKRLFEMENNGIYYIIYVGNYFDNEEYVHLAITMVEHIIHYNNGTVFCKKQLISLADSVDNVVKLKNDYLIMEKIIRTNLDTFYSSLRDYESDIKTQIYNIIDTFKNNEEKLLEKYNNNLLSKIHFELKLTLIEEYDNLYLCKNGIKYFHIKIQKTALQVTFIDPEIKVCIKDINLFLTLHLIKTLSDTIK